MKKQFHILNGDALKSQFPKSLEGEIIVARECLVDGDVRGETLEAFYSIRSHFMARQHGDYSAADYYPDVVAEFEKIQHIPRQSLIYLWFEDDLFCQVNFWFVVFLIHKYVKECKVFLVRPEVHTRFGFGGMSPAQLLQTFTKKQHIKHPWKIARLWELYKAGDTKNQQQSGEELYQLNKQMSHTFTMFSLLLCCNIGISQLSL